MFRKKSACDCAWLLRSSTVSFRSEGPKRRMRENVEAPVRRARMRREPEPELDSAHTSCTACRGYLGPVRSATPPVSSFCQLSSSRALAKALLLPLLSCTSREAMLAAMFPLFALLLAAVTGELLVHFCNFLAVLAYRLSLEWACKLAALMHCSCAPAASPFPLVL